MTESTIAHPKTVSRDEWLVARKALLTKEKELTRHRDALNAERRRLPMVKIDKDYTYSAYARGTECLTDAYSLLDTTPYGRQEDFEDSPPGWPQKPTYG